MNSLRLFYTIIMFVAVKEVECEVKTIYFCPEQSATIYCNVTSDFTKLYWKNSTDYVVASQTVNNCKITKKSPNKTYSSSDRFEVQGLSLKIAFPKDGEQFYCDVVSRKKEIKQHFTLDEYSEPYPDDVCSSPKDTNKTKSRQLRSGGTNKITREINETNFVCINGRTVLKCDNGQHDRPIAEYWEDRYGKLIVSNVDGRLSNTSDARYVFNHMNSTLLVQNLSEWDHLFVCKTVYKNEDIIKCFNLQEYGTPKDSFFEGFENNKCEVDANENGQVIVPFTVACFSPVNAVTVVCELNGECNDTNPQYNVTDDGKFNSQICIDRKIEVNKNLTCTLTGPAMCNHSQEFVCHFKFKENSSSSIRNLVIAILCPIVGLLVIVFVYLRCCQKEEEEHSKSQVKMPSEIPPIQYITSSDQVTITAPQEVT
ncbi:uncharacterized protein LOC117121888 isoform X2 [Anneissia japonica]|nr:uncharacterized protein LOC117121888 isoform X2 [Anneissia japonica]